MFGREMEVAMGIQGVNQMVSVYAMMTDAQRKTEKESKGDPAPRAEKGPEAGTRYNEGAVYTRSEAGRTWQYNDISMTFRAAGNRDVQEKGQERAEASAASRTKESALSDRAKAYLKTLRERYTNMDFIIADYSSESEAQALLASGHGEYNVLIDSATLEQMASDESIRAKYEDILDHAGETFDGLKEELGEDAGYIKQLGISIDASGKTTYYSIIDESLKGNGDRLKKHQEDKKAERAGEEKKAEKHRKEKRDEEKKKEILVKADDLGSFLAQVRAAVAGFAKRP